MADSEREAVEAAWRPAVLVTPASAEEFEHDDFRALVRELVDRAELPADRIDIRLGYLYGDAWPPGWTWVNFILDEAGRTVLDAVIAAMVAWGVDWIRRKRQRDPDARPIKAVIYGPDGKVLREVEARDENA